MTDALVVTPVHGIPEVRPGDDLAALIVQGLRRSGVDLRDDDVLVVSSKVVSKAHGLTAAGGTGARDAAVAEQSRRVVAERVSPLGLTQVVESVAGPVMAAAGVDASNTGPSDVLLLLPRDPDAAAAALRTEIEARWSDGAGAPRVGLVVSDTAGRPWRVGQTDFALGASGVQLSEDLRGSVDADGRSMAVTERCLADEMAAAADLVKGKREGIPVAHLRGIPGAPGPAGAPARKGVRGARGAPGAERRGARALVRTGRDDWFGLGRAEAVRSALGVEPGSALARAVGIASTGAEPSLVRVRRAVAVAMAGLDGTSAEVDPDGAVTLAAPDDFATGVAAARLVVALAGEGFAATVTRPSLDRRPRAALEDPDEGRPVAVVRPRPVPSATG